MTNDEARDLILAFADEYLSASDHRIHSAGLRRDENREWYLEARGNKKGIAGLPATFREIPVRGVEARMGRLL